MTVGGLNSTIKRDSELLAESRFTSCPSGKLSSGMDQTEFRDTLLA
jgi:hypothetical protein